MTEGYQGYTGYGAPLTPQQQQAALARSMIAQGIDTSPIRSGWQGAARLANALVGGLMARQQQQAYQDSIQKNADYFGNPSNVNPIIPGGGASPLMQPPGSGAPAPASAPNASPLMNPPGSSPAAPSPSAGGYDPNVVRQMAPQVFAANGIDPAVGMKVLQSEGLNKYVGDNGSSFGPGQLHYGGVAPGGNAVSGLGDEFTKQTGLDARDPSTVPQQLQFIAQQAAKNGWGPWHGAANSGVGPWDGINRSGAAQTPAEGGMAQQAAYTAPPPSQQDNAAQQAIQAQSGPPQGMGGGAPPSFDPRMDGANGQWANLGRGPAVPPPSMSAPPTGNLPTGAGSPPPALPFSGGGAQQTQPGLLDAFKNSVGGLFGMGSQQQPPPVPPNPTNAPQQVAQAGGANNQNDSIGQRMRQLYLMANDPYATPEAKEMAGKMLEQQMSVLGPHPVTWKAIPGTNNEQAIDWLGRPVSGMNIQGGPQKLAPGESLYNTSPPGIGGNAPNISMVPGVGGPNALAQKSQAEETGKIQGQIANPTAQSYYELKRSATELPSYKEYTAAAPTWNSMIVHAQQDSVPADKAMTDDFVKILNPGRAVGQGAFVLNSDVQSLPEEIQGEVRKLYDGGQKLSPAARAKMMAAAQAKVSEYKGAWDLDADQHTKIAQKYGLDPELATPRVPAMNPFDASKAVTSAPVPGQPGAPQLNAAPALQPQSAIPPAAVDFLRKNPGMSGAFDQKYGAGSSARYLGGQ